jgi:uncharacterized protein involved in exopolysaccharide biosynthesis/Mrp family chromosome partitioning ATPase
MELAMVGERDAAAFAPEAELDLQGIGRTLWRKKWWVLGPTLVVAVATAAIVSMIAPEYKSEARVLIQGRENVFLRPEAEKVDREPGVVDQEAVTSQVQLALSRDLARQVAKQLRLGDRPEFDPVLRGTSWVASLLHMAGLARDPLRMTPEERVLDAYYDHLTVYQVEKSRVIAIEFQSRDPELSAQAANAVAEGYVQLLRTAKQDETRAARQWLAGEIDDLRGKVADAENKAESFRAKSNLFIGSNNTPLSNQQLSEINTDLAAARARKAEAEAKARVIRDMLRSGKPMDSADFLNSELIRRLAEQRATLRAQLAEQSSTLLDAHPRIKELKAQISDIDREMHVVAERLARSLENDAQIASARLDTLNSNLDQLKQQAASTTGQDVELRGLEREARADRDLLESYLAKYREATARDNLTVAPGEARLISRAVASNTPSFPRRLPMILIAALSTFFIAIGIVTSRELFAGDAYVRERVIADAGHSGREIDVLPAGPPAKPEEAPPPAHVISGATAVPEWPSQSLVDIVAALQPSGVPGRRVVVAGAGRNVGTLGCAVSLARLLTQQGRVVLVDVALGAAAAAPQVTAPGGPGITDLVRGAASFGQVITRDTNSNVHLISSGQIQGEEARALLASERLRIALDALAHAYEYVVIDVGEAAQMLLERLANRAALVVLVTTGATRPAVQLARERFAHAGFVNVLECSELEASGEQGVDMQPVAA